MKKLIISAATALILAMPAFAHDHHDHGDKHGGGGPGGQAHAAPAPAPKAAPNMPSGGGDNRVRGRVNGQPVTVDQVRAHFGVNNQANPGNANNNGGRHHDRGNNNGFNGNNNNNNGFNSNGGRGGFNRPSRGSNGAHVTINFNRRNVTASHHYRYRGGAYRGPSGYSYRRWTYGQTFPSIYFTQNYWISDYEDYGLAYPPDGAVWVRYGNDAILVDEDSGEILEVVYDQFY